MANNFSRLVKLWMSFTLGAGMFFYGFDAQAQSTSPNQLVKLVDYMGADYGIAVANNQIINASEYEEIQNFHQLATEHLIALLGEAKDQDAKTITLKLAKFGDLIKGKKEPAEVYAASQEIRSLLLERFSIVAAPLSLPQYDLGKKLFAANCAICHGPNGNADTSIAKTLDPRPANFQDNELIGALSPFKAFNVVSLGVEGTSMPAFSALTEDERWSVSFYLFTLRHEALKRDDSISTLPTIPLSLLSDLTDDQLEIDLKNIHNVSNPVDILGRIRKFSTYSMKTDGLTSALQFLQIAEASLNEKDFRQASKHLLSAYLDGFEKVEPRLKVTNPELTQELERSFLVARTASDNSNQKKSIGEIKKIKRNLLSAQTALNNSEKGWWFLFVSSLFIILREGIEAALIVGAILGVLRAAGDKTSKASVHRGWISAILLTLITWFASLSFIEISGAGRETVEGFAALLAAGVLFYISFWLISKIDARKWSAFIQSKVQGGLASGNTFALAGISFLAVYREGLETVLFYQALLQGNTSEWLAIAVGVVAGVIILSAVIFSIFRLGLRIPLPKFFAGTSALLYILGFIMAGEGVRALQEAGMLPYHLVSFPEISMLGIYSSLEGLIAQGIFAIALVIGGLWVFKISKHQPISSP